jgi:hypothetical protein
MDSTTHTALTELFERLRTSFAQELDNYENSDRRSLHPEREIEARARRDLCATALHELRTWYAPESQHSYEEDMPHWTTIELHNADGSGRNSRWDPNLACAVQATTDGIMERSPAITEEHLRALAELRDQDSCANWYTDEALDGTGPRRDDIDWSGFEAPEDEP